ncbi:MAG TPA: HigA family addiction module antitoxin [Burkholderiaceae bacterium]|jgi:addiction module HigA family antidote
MNKSLDEIHPAEILTKEFLAPRGITPEQLVVMLGWPESYLVELLSESLAITDDIALSLGLFFNMDAKFWSNLQTEFDRRTN